MSRAESHDNRGLGILWMLATSFCFISLDSMMKILLEQGLPLVQVTWARFFFATIFAFSVTGRSTLLLLKSHAPGIQSLRSLFLMLTTVAFNAGIRTIPLATATTIMFMSPIFVTILSIPFLGEHVGLRRWAGVLLAFLGASLVIRPWEVGLGGLGTGVLMLLIAALLNANYQVLTRKVRQDNPLTSLLFTAAAGALVTSCLVPWYWHTPSTQQWLVMAAAGLMAGLGHFCLIRAFRLAPASVVAPFGYSSLIWATLSGVAIWGQWPDGWTWAGAAIIVTAGLYIFSREQRLHRPSATTVPEN